MLAKKSIKQFLKPDYRKILILLILAISVLFFEFDIQCPAGWLCEGWGVYRGLPLPVFTWIHVFGDKNAIFNYFLSSLVLDLIFWYLVSCLLISIWDKIKTKKIGYLKG